MDTTPPYAGLALSLTVPDWEQMGIEPGTKPTSDLETLCDRVTSLLLVRVVAQTCPEYSMQQHNSSVLSTTGICRSALMKQEPWSSPITPDIINQVRQYCQTILSNYNDVPYHSREHACHVVLSTNKLIDMMWDHDESRIKQTKSYGLRRDPLSLTAMVFAAIIHDVEHRGVPNRQLASEDDELALLYNDESIAENRSLYVGFKEFLKPDYAELRAALFPTKDDYRRFRKHVVNLVLNTDIASPERTQLAKSKWKEAFGQSVPASCSETGAGSPALSRTSSRASGDKNFAEAAKAAVAESGGGGGDTENGGGEDDMLRYVRRSMTADIPPKLLEPESMGVSRTQSLPAAPRTFRKRLGIRRSMDLSGEALETFSTRHDGGPGGFGDDDDGADELKAAVVMECIITAADVAHNLQGWDQMVMWSSRLYEELRKAHVEGRGVDVSGKWFENQIGFLESYLLPLAQQLDTTGVFGNAQLDHEYGVADSYNNDENGGGAARFANIVTSSRDHWLLDGVDVAQKTIKKGNEAFPGENFVQC